MDTGVKDTTYHPTNTMLTMRFGGGNLIVWGCLSAYSTDVLHIIEGRMNRKNVQIHSQIKSAAICPHDEDETKMDVSAGQ